MGPLTTPEVALAHALDLNASPYGRLGLKDARYTPSEIRQAYHTAALLLHPDKCDLPDATRAFQCISQAFNTLSQPGAEDQVLGSTRKSNNSEFSERQHGPRKKDHVFTCERKLDDGREKWWTAGWFELEERLRRHEIDARVARRMEALDKAMKCGEDLVDSYRTLIQEEVAGAASHGREHTVLLSQ